MGTVRINASSGRRFRSALLLDITTQNVQSRTAGVSRHDDPVDDDGFVEQHPELHNGKGTLKLPVGHDVGDDELLALIRSSLS